MNKKSVAFTERFSQDIFLQDFSIGFIYDFNF